VWVVEVRGRELRQVTDTPGYDAETPLWHPSGESIVFTHTSRPPLKIIQATGGMPKPIVKTSGMNVRPIGWLPDDQSLVYSILSFNPKTYEMKTTIERVNLDGKSLPIQVDVPGQAAFSALSPKGDKLAYVSHGELWIRPVGQDAISKLLIPGPAFYPSWSGDNQILFVSAGKLMRVNVETGIISQISHDLSYKVEPSTGSLLIRNARLLTPDPKEGLWDLYIKDGRISSIEKSSDKRRRADRELDVEGRTIIPGLFDIHSHIFRRFPAEGQLYWGVTSVSGAGGPGHWIVTQQEAIRSGRRLGPRIFPACGFVVPSAMNAFPQFFRIKTQDQLERFLDHLIGLEATQVKCFNRRDPWVEAAAISAAHKRGLPTLSHFIRPASVAAGQDRKEHAFYYSWGGGAGVRFQQDIIEILRKAKMTISTTITFPFVATKQGRERVANALSLPEVSSFLPPAQIKRLRRQIERKVPEATNLEWTRMQDASKANVLSARNAGIKIVVGTDYTVFVGYIAVHWEMEFLVEAGFSPVEALRAATQDAAATLGLEGQLGIIAPGAVADLVVLEADPLDDIRNTQKIHRIIKDGNIVDRDALLKEMQK
jgi:imidazolonepropionase-like amidohydrolase